MGRLCTQEAAREHKSPSIIVRREKPKFWARLTNGNGVIPSLEKVVCEIVLPKRPNGEVHATFFPTIEQYRHLDNVWEFSFTGDQKLIDGTITGSIVGKKVLITNSERQHWDFDLADIRCFATVEELAITHFHDQAPEARPRVQAEFWITANKAFKKKLKKVVSSVAKEDDVLAALPSKREYLYDKLDELNRISFGRALKAFCGYYAVDLSDLWQLTGMVTSLSDIRNRLVHGYRFQPASYLMLMSAHENLRLIAERMVLAMLEWPISNSTADPGFLSLHNSLYKSWKTDWKELTTLLRSEITIPEESQISTENIT